jgi:anti-sigma regulatory factor (Ser/Thr protein kinase)
LSTNGLGVEGRGRQDERVARWDLPAETGSAATARALTGEALRQWRVPDQADVDDIVLMVDELVTNAVLHGQGQVRLRLRMREAHITAEVGDDSPVRPAPPGRGPDLLEWAEDGRGLLLVGALASAFGTRPETHGKTVWFSRTLRSMNGHSPATGDQSADPPSLTSS